MGEQAVVLCPERVFDGDGARLPQGTCVRIAGGLIADVGPLGQASGGDATVLRLGGMSLTPGFIDLHAYLSVEPDRPDPMRRMFDPDLAARRATALKHLEVDLASGVTTLRVMGEGGGLDMALRDEAAAGALHLPSLFVCGAPIAPTGSHQAPEVGGADTSEAVRAAVESRKALGADFVKLVLTGGVNAPGGGGTTALYDTKALDAFFAAARQAGLAVAVAAHGGAGVAEAVARGAVSIEHCALATPADLTVLTSGLTLPVLTLTRFFAPEGIERSAAGSPAILERLGLARERLMALCGALASADTPFGLGSDNMHGRLADDVRFATAFGLPFARGLAAVTGVAASLIGTKIDRGFVRAGLRADLVALRGDPSTDVTALSRVDRVWKAGREVWTTAAGELGETSCA